MARTAENECLSLRDTVLRWCDPVLVDAVKNAEAPFTEDQILAACPCSLGGGAPAVPDPPDLDSDAVARVQVGFSRPWNNLIADLRRRIMISRIVLTGIEASDPEAIRVTIPPSYVSQYEFDLVGSTIVWSRGKWLSVTASLTTEAAAIEDCAKAPLPLKQAMLTWCDDLLVDRYETADLARQLAQDIRQGFRFPARERRYAGVSTFDLHLVEPWAERLEGAKTAVQTDFAARIACREIELTGLQTEPALAADSTSLSPAWAGRMKFNWQNGMVQVGGVRFVEVSGIRKTTPNAPETDFGGQPERGGRPGFPMNEMVEIARQLDSRESTNKGAASALLNEFKTQFPDRQAPSHRTVVDHVAEIYRKAALKARA